MTRTFFAGAALFAVSAATLLAQQPKISKGEAEAYNNMVKAAQSGDNDAVIAAADNLVTKYSDTQFKAVALNLEAHAYHQKGDDDHAQVIAEQAMAADPKGYAAPLLIGETIIQHTRENDLDKDQKLATAEKDLNLAIENAKSAPKPNPAISDAQWEEQKKFTVAEGQADLGRVFMDRKKFSDAVVQLQAALDADPQPAYYIWLAMSQQGAGKNDEAIATCDKLLAQPNITDQFKNAANTVKRDAMRAKGAK